MNLSISMGGDIIRISGEVYNCIINQAIVMKHDLNEDGNVIARKVVEEYFDDNELTSDEKLQFIEKIADILN